MGLRAAFGRTREGGKGQDGRRWLDNDDMKLGDSDGWWRGRKHSQSANAISDHQRGPERDRAPKVMESQSVNRKTAQSGRRRSGVGGAWVRDARARESPAWACFPFVYLLRCI